METLVHIPNVCIIYLVLIHSYMNSYWSFKQNQILTRVHQESWNNYNISMRFKRISVETFQDEVHYFLSEIY